MSLRPSRRAPVVPRIAFELEDRRLDGSARGTVVVSVGGEVDFAAGPRLKERLFAHLADAGSVLVLDLSAVTFIDSMAIGVLVSAATRAREVDGALSVVCASDNERVLRIFDIAGVAGLIALHRTLDDALAAPGDGAQGAGLGRVAPEGSWACEPSATQPSRPAVARSYAAPAAGAERPPRGSSENAGHVDELA